MFGFFWGVNPKQIEKVSKHYGVTNIVVNDIEKVDGHPTYAGMQSICEQVYEVICY